MAIIYFPQWQGTGDGSRFPLERSAAVFRSYLCNRYPGVEECIYDISLDTCRDLELHQDILGRQALLRQFVNAGEIITAADPQRIGLIGGDCAVELAPVSFLYKKYQDSFALLWLDAHADINLPETSPSNAMHGMPLRVLLGEGDKDFVSRVHPLKHQQIYLAGVRDVDAEERIYIQESQINSFSLVNGSIDVDELCVIMQSRQQHKIYVHFDVDVLDPSEFPYTSIPSAGGIKMSDAVHVLRVLEERFELVGFSITEYLSKDGLGLEILDPISEYLIHVGCSDL